MPDLIDPLQFSSDPALPEGAAGLVFTDRGGLFIAHNIAAIRETGMMQGESMGPILMALAALEMVNDEKAFEAALTRAVKKLSQLEGPSPSTVTN